MARDVLDGWARDARGNVVPPESRTHRMVIGVEPVATEIGEVDAADERDLAVDDHELLVVAVHRPLVRVERTLHARATDELIAYPLDRPPCRREQRHRRAGPQQDSDTNALSEIAEQIAKPPRTAIAPQAEIRT